MTPTTSVCVGFSLLCALWMVSDATVIRREPRALLADALSCFRKQQLRLLNDNSDDLGTQSDDDDYCRELLSKYSTQDIKCLFSPIGCMFRDYVQDRR
ncbi:unnamed protein product [Cylicocyclus nassatus]|uniref:Uncharacterized protein n=1 Tax=Cylicocyclus nassatus TaxID=53992 RepID=A0AA36MD27_CYLNA|nr:unnamed protein product [Cylicocyclus nassatus]